VLHSVEAFATLHPKNKRNAAVRLVKFGASAAFNFIGLQIFIEGLRPNVRVPESSLYIKAFCTYVQEQLKSVRLLLSGR
jgi:hypothetical protein